MILEGMGRSLHTNFDAKFKCDTLKVICWFTLYFSYPVVLLNCVAISVSHDKEPEISGPTRWWEHIRLRM